MLTSPFPNPKSQRANQRSNKNDRDGLNPALKEAKFTLAEFLKNAMKWIVDEYSHTRGEDGRSPAERWQEQVAGLDLRPPLMAQPEFAQFIMPESLKFRDSGGLERNSLRYQSDRLDELRRSVGNKSSVLIRVNPQNIETIFVADARCREWFSVPCVEEPSYVRGLTNEQHAYTLKFAKEAKKQMRSTAKHLVVTRDDLRLDALKGQYSRQLTVRGHAFLIKHAFRSLPTLDRLALAESALQEAKVSPCADHDAHGQTPLENKKAKPSLKQAMADLFSEVNVSENL